MRLLNAIELYEARILAASVVDRRRWSKAAAARGDVAGAGRATVEVVLLRRRLDRLGRRAA